VTTDMLLAGRHFFPTRTRRSSGNKARRVNLSDLAAMAADPRWALLADRAPQGDEKWIAAFARGLLRACRRFQHRADRRRHDAGARSRSRSRRSRGTAGARLACDAARPGDDVWLSRDGEAALALAHLKGRVKLKAACAMLPSSACTRPSRASSSDGGCAASRVAHSTFPTACSPSRARRKASAVARSCAGRSAASEGDRACANVALAKALPARGRRRLRSSRHSAPSSRPGSRRREKRPASPVTAIGVVVAGRPASACATPRARPCPHGARVSTLRMIARPDARFVLRPSGALIALGFGTGLAPVAPGTVGTALAFPIYLLLDAGSTPWSCSR